MSDIFESDTMIRIWHRSDTPAPLVEMAPDPDFILCVVVPKDVAEAELDESIEALLEYSYIRPDLIEYQEKIVYYTFH